MAVSLSLHRTTGRSTARLSLCSHDTDAALGPPQAPRHGQRGTVALHSVSLSSLPVGRVFSWPAATTRSMSLTSQSAPPVGAGLLHVPMSSTGASTSAHLSSVSPLEAVLTAVWACGLAPMHRHTLPPSALMATSDTLKRLSLHAEPFYRPQGAERWPCTSLSPLDGYGSYNGRITVRLSLASEESSQMGALMHTCIFRKIEKEAGGRAP